MSPLRFRAKAVDEKLGLIEFGMGEIASWIEADGVFYVEPNDGEIPLRIPCEISSIQQSTSMKDQDDKEIFQDDIVEDNDGETWLVYWAAGVAAFRLEMFNRDRREVWFRDMEEGDCIRVIGNKWENPDLLPSQ